MKSNNEKGKFYARVLAIVLAALMVFGLAYTGIVMLVDKKNKENEKEDMAITEVISPAFI